MRRVFSPLALLLIGTLLTLFVPLLPSADSPAIVEASNRPTTSLGAPLSGIEEATAIAAGEGFSCALIIDGTVRCWGNNTYGQLGDGTTITRTMPVTVHGLSNVVAITAGSGHACALLTNGTVRCWGRNLSGELGDGTVSLYRLTPVAVNGLANVTAIDGGHLYTCALLSDGTVRCWGFNNTGQLGDGTTDTRLTPVIVNGLSGATAIAANHRHTCAVLNNGTVRCWGSNHSGQLGDGTTTNRLTPVTVSGLSGARSVAVGGSETCALLSDSSIRCWGNGRSLPEEVDGLSGVTAITIGGPHKCAILNDATVRCWGLNDVGQLGDGTTIARPTPVMVQGLHNVAAIAASAKHTCALLNDGAVACWGSNSSGQLGNGMIGYESNPVIVNDLRNVTAVAAGLTHTCAVLQDGTVHCWGENRYGQIGNGATTTHPTPVMVSGLSNVTAVAAGMAHTCAIADGTVHCWGYNGSGQLGDGTTAIRSTPVAVSGLNNAEAIAAGEAHTCVLLADKTVRCWGSNAYGQLGDGSTTNRPLPVAVVGLSSVMSITAGSSHTCAVLDNGTVRCWGLNGTGQLGDGTRTNSSTPVEVNGLSGVIALAAGAGHTCAMLNNNTVRCWGSNYNGEIGIGANTTDPVLSPVAVSGLSGVSAIAAKHVYTCALLSNGTVQCWGNGQPNPGEVIGLNGVSGIAIGGSHTCVRLTDATAKCWGSNDYGQLGNGIPGYSPLPVRVIGLHIPLHIISGWVRDASGTPVAGVTVSDGTRSATTDAAGQYTLTNVPTGTYILTPARSGYTFSPPTRTVTVNGNVSGMDFIADPISSIRPIDMTVWFYRVPTAQQRVVYEDMFRFFADALFEMSNGVHQLRNVRVISDPAQRPQANIYWVERCWPNAHISGYGINGLRILMCDQFVDNNGAVVFDYLNAPAGREQGGYTLAHELGHYFYSLYDEYKGRDACNAARPGRPCRDDVPVSPSIMNSHWNAGNGVYEWLNFSTALNNTYQTAQHRMYRASGWETLARSPDADPRDGVLNNYPRRLYHPELAAVAPPSGQQPRIDLTPGHQARRLLRITWETTTASLAGATDLTASLHALNGGAVTYPEPIRLLAFVQRTHTIAGATVDGVVQTPGGQRHPVTLRDDGVAPDLIADDGVYAGVILPAENGEHRIEMEDVLDVSQRPYDPAYPVGCLDEAGKELHDAPRGVPPLQAEQPVRQDDEYERRGVANLFLAIEPLRGWRARRDFAEQLRLPADEDYPQARRIVLVADNLNTHGPGALYEAFEPEEAQRLAARFEWHDTPEHGSRLTIAECELSVLARQCLDRRIPDKDALAREGAAWERRRNQAAVKAVWQFTAADAGIKLRRLCPVIKEQNLT